MNGKTIFLDTNIVIDYFKDESRYEAKLLASDYSLSRIVMGELYAGAFHSARPERHCRKIERFAKLGRVIEIDEETELEYGRIWSRLAKKGKPIPTNDIWIAAVAMQYGGKLITQDRHFEHVEGLDYEKW